MIFFLIFSFVFLVYEPVWAARVELKNGLVYEGTILEQDTNSIILETPQGIRSIVKRDLTSLPAGVTPPAADTPEPNPYHEAVREKMAQTLQGDPQVKAMMSQGKRWEAMKKMKAE